MPYLEDQTFSFYTRDVGAQLTPNATQKTTLIVAGCYVIIIAILWHVPVLSWISALLTVGFHEMSHAITGILTCATIHSVELDPDEGGETRMSGGIPWITLPAGYLGSSFIGACLIACGFDTNASKIACLVLGVFFLFTLWWARRNWLTWILILGMSGLIVLFWLVADSVALRYFILFVGVMSDLYVLWDVIDDTISRKVNSSDASAFARICGCFPSQVWGVIWLLVAFAFFAAGIIVGLVVFKVLASFASVKITLMGEISQESSSEQESSAAHFLPAPGSSGAMASVPLPGALIMIVTNLLWQLLL
ncbi:peptidase M50B-like-domain-containing protein [Suillus bovinus]|uniref:peptidase M50B-like-domain-containing protein n=1 Tax=Suillus bovinus TaxID=48563 RepID=UPI001B87E459|nr:peptidase M50B-like-domain-containing protein [Suillus bovinus]KAG2140975.1 peptidase M50B-like-domain-containing protein [Suillus bovinus]